MRLDALVIVGVDLVFGHLLISWLGLHWVVCLGLIGWCCWFGNLFAIVLNCCYGSFGIAFVVVVFGF